MLTNVVRDLRYAARVMRRHRGLSAVIVLTLALAIGANTAIFSIMDALLLQALPVRDPQNLMLLEWSAHKSPFHSWSSYGDCEDRGHGDTNVGGCSFSMPFYQDLKQQAQSLQAVTAAAGAHQYNLSGQGQASILAAQAVAGNYFSVLGVEAAFGRTLTPSDDLPASPLALVLNYRYWQSAFGGRRDVVGQTVEVNNLPVTIVGVAAPSFVALTPGSVYDGWLPLSALPRLTPHWRPQRNNADSIYLTLFARLRPHVQPAQAKAEVNLRFRNALLNGGVSGGAPLAKPADDPRATMVSAQTGLQGVRAEYMDPLTILMWTVGVILLMACANVAGLLLGRASARQKEIALRRALGARAGQILGQLMTESLLLSAIGGALGLAVGWIAAQALLAMMSSASDGPLGLHASLDARVLLFALGASIVTGVIFGLAPALRAARVDLQASLKDGVGNTAAGSRRRLHLGNGLVVAQVALCMVVLAGAGLLVRSLSNLRSVNPGFDTSHVLLFTLEPELIGYKGAAVDRLYQGIQERVGALPGVRGVSFSESPLLSGDLSGTDYHIVPGGPTQEARVLPVGLNFFATMKLPLKLGRDFAPSDFVPDPDDAAAVARAPKAPAAPEAIIVNEAFVRKFLGSGNPIGRVFGIGDNGASGGWKIIGVVGDALYQRLQAPVAPTTYTPSSEGYATFEVRTAGDPMAALAPIRQTVHAIDRNLPLSQVSTQARNIDRTLFRERMMADLASCFGMLALLLASIGLYGLLAQEVTRRTREIGIRMALGAQRGQVLRMILKLGAALGVIGLVFGMAGAWGATRYLQSMLFGVGASDPVTLAAVALLLLVVSLAACLIPSRRATRVDPLEALRYE